MFLLYVLSEGKGQKYVLLRSGKSMAGVRQDAGVSGVPPEAEKTGAEGGAAADVRRLGARGSRGEGFGVAGMRRATH